MRRNGTALVLGRRPFTIDFAFAAMAMAACQRNLAVSVSPVAGGGVVALPSRVDLGHVPFNQLAHARFALTNAGTTAVHLGKDVRVQTLEGC
jgi:hypothetical protein